MAMVNTVKGPVDSNRLGQTMIHEHIIVRTPGVAEAWPERWDREFAVRRTVAKLKEAAEAGVGTVIDLTPADMGRDPRLMQRIAEQVRNVHIIASTGVYHPVPRYWASRDVDDMARSFIKDITAGISGSSVKAGAIKLATDTGGAPDTGVMIPAQEKALRAGARAHRATGIPILTHNGPHTTARMQQRIFKEEGVVLDGNVLIGHVGDTDDIGFLKEIADGGGFIGMDRLGIYRALNFEAKVKTIVTLCKDGYADRIALGHDACGALDWVVDIDAGMPADWKYAHVCQKVLPALREGGVTEAQIRQIVVENPKRLLEPAQPY